MQKIKAVLFDLDGTMLPMDQDAFTQGYFKLLVKKLAPCGYEPEALVKAVWHGTKAMVMNDGSKTNEAAFWDDFTAAFGEEARRDEALFREFYEGDFEKARAFCGCTPKAAEAVTRFKNAGCRVALA
ncbi:MAG: HAD family hydrolase, partial [Clostridia bacterium]|nr:HAD family hydrolase [Clostridia bacterium]